MHRKPFTLVPGVVFRTPYESGCVVQTVPDDTGDFLALDSEGVSCHFSVVMVEAILDFCADCGARDDVPCNPGCPSESEAR